MNIRKPLGIKLIDWFFILAFIYGGVLFFGTFGVVIAEVIGGM